MSLSNNSSALPNWVELAVQEAWKDSLPLIRRKKQLEKLESYRGDPVAFGEQVLGEHYTEDVKRVMNSVRDNPVTIAKSGNAVGKSHAAARIAVWFFKCFPDSQVYLVAAPPLDNLKRILWGEVLYVINNHGELFETDYVRSMNVTRHSKSFIAAVAIPTSGTEAEREAKFSGKHAPNMLFIIDEGDAVPPEVYRGIDSCMSGDNAHLLVMFNPRAQLGPVYDMESSAKANVVQLPAMHHPNVTSGDDIIPGAVSRDITVRRINEWTRPIMDFEKTGADTFELPEFLVGAVAQSPSGATYDPLKAGSYKIVEPQFSYMVLGEYPPQGEKQLISTAWLDAAVQRWKDYVAVHGEVPPDTQPIMGSDIAELGVDANVTMLRYDYFVPRPIIWSGIDLDMSAQKALDIYVNSNPVIAYIDATGLGSGVAPLMIRVARERRVTVHAIGVKVSNKPTPGSKIELGEFYQLRDQLWWACREWFRTNPNAMIPPDPFLIADLRAVTYYVRENGKVKVTDKGVLRDQLKRSTDRGDALCLTFMPMLRATIAKLDQAESRT